MDSLQTIPRCQWARTALSIAYHDTEWGVPSRDDRHLFEHIVLEGAQAGLSWELVLQKRSGYRKAFAGFDISKVAKFDEAMVERLVNDPSIVRNRQKIRSAVRNAGAALKVSREHGSLADYLWGLVGHRTVHNTWSDIAELPALTSTSERVSKELKQKGFSFVGPVGIYSFMQAVGMVNDHVVDCHRYPVIRKLASN